MYVKIKPLIKPFTVIILQTAREPVHKKRSGFFLIKCLETNFLNIIHYIICSFKQAILHKITK